MIENISGVEGRDASCDHHIYGNTSLNSMTGSAQTQPGSKSEESFEEIDNVIENGCFKKNSNSYSYILMQFSN